MKISRNILHHKLNNRKNFQIYQLTICWLMIFFPDLPLHESKSVKMSGSLSSIVSQLIHQAVVAPSAAPARVNDLHCPRNWSIVWFNMQMIQNRPIGCQCVQPRIPISGCHCRSIGSWKVENGIFHRSRLPRWRGRRNLIKIGEVSLSGGPSNQLDDKWPPFRSNGSFWKNERQPCIPAGSVVNGLGDGARCEV